MGRLDSAMAGLFSALEGLSETALYSSPGEGEWTAMQTLAHVAELVPFWARRAAEVAEGHLQDRPYDRSAEELELRNGVLAEHAHDSLSEMLVRLRAAQHEAAAILRAIPADRWSRTALWGPERVEHSVQQLVEERLVKHVEAHARQAWAAASANTPPVVAPQPQASR